MHLGLIPQMTSNSAPSGVASASGYAGAYEPYYAMNKTDIGDLDCWVSTGGSFVGSWSRYGSAWLRYELPVAEVVTKYSIKSPLANVWPYSSHAPEDWTFEASNDASSWVTLDTKTGVSWTREETKEYSVTNIIPYLYYRVNVTRTTGDQGVVAIGELQIMKYITGVSSVTHVGGI